MTRYYAPSVRISVALVAFGFLAFSAETRSQTIIYGEIVGVTRILAQNTGATAKPMRNVEVRIQAQDEKMPAVVARTNANGRYFIGTLPPGVYTIKIFVDGNLEFAAGSLKTRVGNPLRIDYNMRIAVVSMSNATSKRTRRFAWQQSVTGSHLDGRWIETDAVDGYEAPFSQIERKSGFAMFQASRGF